MESELFAVTAPGVEPVTAEELHALGMTQVDVTPGGVSFAGGTPELRRANLELRTAGRVLVRTPAFRASRFDDLSKHAARLPWKRFLRPGDRVALRVTCHKSRLFHSAAVAERVAGAAAAALGFEPPRVKPAADEGETAPQEDAGRTQLVLVRLDHDRCTVSFDSSGEPLHRRGHRLATGRAPLRETLAAALLAASGWDAASPLVDPFCGAGTIAIEAALLACRRAPGRHRRFAFEHWSDHDASAWQELLAEVDARAAAAPAPPPILASDRDAGAVAATTANAERAGTRDRLTLARQALSDLVVPPGPGFIVTNPPHGVRLRSGDLRHLHAQLGKVLRARCPGWRVAILATDVRLWSATGLALTPTLRMSHGGLWLSVATGTVPEHG